MNESHTIPYINSSNHVYRICMSIPISAFFKKNSCFSILKCSASQPASWKTSWLSNWLPVQQFFPASQLPNFPNSHFVYQTSLFGMPWSSQVKTNKKRDGLMQDVTMAPHLSFTFAGRKKKTILSTENFQADAGINISELSRNAKTSS